MYAEHAITCSARFAIHRSIPWMWLCGCLSTQPWWRPYSVAWIVTASGASKRLARWSPATATSQSCPCTTSKSKRSPSSTPAASMSVFMCSTHAMNSPSSAGRRGSRTLCRCTPSTTSSGGDSSRPRVRTCTSTPWHTRFSDTFRTCRASPPSISGGYSQERIRIRKAAYRPHTEDGSSRGASSRWGARSRRRSSIAAGEWPLGERRMARKSAMPWRRREIASPKLDA